MTNRDKNRCFPRTANLIVLLIACLLIPATVGTASDSAAVTVAVVTGQHAYDVPNFHKLFRSLEGVDAYIQNMEDFATSSEEVRDSYDVVVFFFMPRQGPESQKLTKVEESVISAMERLGTTQQGIVVLHHAILGYSKWPLWSEVVGIADRKFGYHMGQKLRVDVAASDHPITEQLQAWDMTDETYTMADAGAGSTILLTTNHPKSMKTIGWTRDYKNARVFCFASGHDNDTWVDASFREVLRRGILWSARGNTK